jgi:hypothetical protein
MLRFGHDEPTFMSIIQNRHQHYNYSRTQGYELDDWLQAEAEISVAA